MKKLICILILLFSFTNIFPEKLLDKEIVSDVENTEIKIEKIFIYDPKNNIIEIRDFRNKKLTSKYQYTYTSNILESVEEYINGINKVIKSKFEYSASNTLLKKTDFDNNDNIIMSHEYIYNGKNIIEIRDYLPDQTYLGKKIFIYINDKITEEYLVDTNNNKIIIKKYIYKNNLIDSIEYYTYKGEKIRIIKRVYLNKKDNTSIFGLRDNFYDIR